MSRPHLTQLKLSTWRHGSRSGLGDRDKDIHLACSFKNFILIEKFDIILKNGLTDMS